MFEALRAPVLSFLKVPPEPRVPDAGKTIRVFRAAPAYFKYKLVLWAAGQVAALIGLFSGLFFIGVGLDSVGHPLLRFLLIAAEAFAWALFLVQLPVTLAVLRLDWDMRWYILSDRSLRIREGIVALQEKTMTFANIQQISIKQNPLQRILGISDVQVRTAGGGASGGGKGDHAKVGEGMHEAYFRGVDNAEEIRIAIRERVRLHRGAGLGDPEDERAGDGATAAAPVVESLPVGAPASPSEQASADPILAAARELRRELQALRELRSPATGVPTRGADPEDV